MLELSNPAKKFDLPFGKAYIIKKVHVCLVMYVKSFNLPSMKMSHIIMTIEIFFITSTDNKENTAINIDDRELLNATALLPPSKKAIIIFWVFYQIWVQQLNQKKNPCISGKPLDLRLLAQQNYSTENSILENGDIWWCICFLKEIVKEMVLKLIAIVAGFHQSFTGGDHLVK